MKYKGFFVKAVPAACAAGILMLAVVMCQKPQSAKTGAKQAVSNSTMTANKAVTADTSVKKADSVVMSKKADSVAMATETGYYTCPMHPKIHQAKPGKCPICKMDLVFKKNTKATTTVKGMFHSRKKM